MKGVCNTVLFKTCEYLGVVSLFTVKLVIFVKNKQKQTVTPVIGGPVSMLVQLTRKNNLVSLSKHSRCQRIQKGIAKGNFSPRK